MKYLQKLGSSLMLPVSILVVAALLMGVGYALDPAALSGSSNVVAVFMVQAGLVIIENLEILFAVGVAVGLAHDNNGVAALSGVVSFLMMTTMLAPETISLVTGQPVDAIDSAFVNIQNVFIGILAGLIAGWAYNRFHDFKLPQWLSFFSGKRSVAIVTALVSVLVTLVLFFAWPLIYNALTWLGVSISSLGAVGAGLFGFFNRLLIPLGLHHAFNNVFWFDTIGINDIGNFWQSTGVLGQTGMYQGGFFPIMMFGLPAGALAIYKNAKPENKKQILSLVVSAAVASFITGITEPLEFSFMFVAPQLFAVHAVLTGLSLFIAASLNATAGFTFSAGLIDFIINFRMPLANRLWILVVMGFFFFVVYFIVFDLMIQKLDLKTPGRGEQIDNNRKLAINKAEDKYEQMASEIYQALGGHKNIENIDHCATRLRLTVGDIELIDQNRIQNTGVPGLRVIDQHALQIIVGTDVQFVANRLTQLENQKIDSNQLEDSQVQVVKSNGISSGRLEIASPVDGELVSLTNVPDQAFASKALGEGLAIIPDKETIYSPVAGEIVTVFPTGHAIGLKAENGAEILLHIGLNTVELDGEGFEVLVKPGRKVQEGDPLIHFDKTFLKDHGYNIITPVVVTNSEKFDISNFNESVIILARDVLFTVEAK